MANQDSVPDPEAAFAAIIPTLKGDDDELEEPSSFPPSPAAAAAATTSPKRKGRKRDKCSLRKAPQAPKRFKSSYICFFMEKQPEIKVELGEKATVTEISKRSAELWRTLSPEDRAYWDDIAAKDKQRYMAEKASYTGPWQVPWKRAKKDPSAPKRPMSAFLYFSQGRRKEIKDANPDLKNTEVSRLLGEMWRSAAVEDRQPHVDKEKKEREKYKIAIAEWRQEYEKKKEEQRKQQEEQQAQWKRQYPAVDQSGQAQAAGAHLPYPHPPHPYHQAPPPGYAPYPGQYSQPYPAYPPNYPYPQNGKQPVILGPNGMPHYPHAPMIPPHHLQQQQARHPAYHQQHSPVASGQQHPQYEDNGGSLEQVPGVYGDYPTDQVTEPQTAE